MCSGSHGHYNRDRLKSASDKGSFWEWAITIAQACLRFSLDLRIGTPGQTWTSLQILPYSTGKDRHIQSLLDPR